MLAYMYFHWFDEVLKILGFTLQKAKAIRKYSLDFLAMKK